MKAWQELAGWQQKVLIVAYLGWLFDIADSALFNFAKVPMLTQFMGEAAYKATGPAVEGRIQMLFLLGWSLGGLIFGLLADSWGRMRTLSLTVLIYSIFTGLTAFCHSVEQVTALRFLTGLGIGGEWAAGTALVAESLPDNWRPRSATFLQSAAAFGPIIAAVANISLGGKPFGFESWQALFLVGTLPAILTGVLRFRMAEAETKRETKKFDFAPMATIFKDAVLRRNALVALAMGFVGIAGAGNVTYWLPNLVKSLSSDISKEVVQQRQTYATFSLHAGTLLGVLIFPRLCQLWGRKRAFAVFFLGAPVALGIVGFGATTYQLLLILAPMMSFFTIGLTSGFILYFPELFPASVRATGIGLAYNTGRILNVPVPLVTGLVIQRLSGNISAGILTTASIYGLGLLALRFAPESGRLEA